MTLTKAQHNTATTRDLGFFIRDMIEGRTFHRYREDDEGELIDIGNDAYVNYVDVSDPDNLIVALASGETFIVRIVRQG